MIKGIDVSKWQGNIDWKKVENDGVEFAMIKACQSTNITDSFFKRNIENAQNTLVKTGAYHYSKAMSVDDAKKEADYMLSVIKGYKLDYPIAYDVEDSTQIPLGKQKITDIVIAYLDKISEAGYKTLLYVNTNWRNNYIDMSHASKYPLWQAHYPENPNNKPTAIDGKVAIWQYSDKGKVNGISGNVDMNWDFVDLSQPKAVQVPAQPAPAPSTAIIKGDNVKINRGAKSYENKNMAAFVYDSVYKVDELKGDRAVLNKTGICTAFNVKDLTKV